MKAHKYSPEADDSADQGLIKDRRGDDRTTAVYRPVLIETEEFVGFCLVKNLSPGGMMGIAYAQFAPRQPITVHFHPEHVAAGTIVWSRDERIGVAFDERIDVEDVLHDLASKIIGTKVNRAPRLTIECRAEMTIEGRVTPILVLDISQRGIKAAVPELRPGDEVVVRLPGLDAHKAEVRWTQAGMAGLNFVRPIGFEELAKWAIDRQA